MCKVIWFCINFSNIFEIIDRTLTGLSFLYLVDFLKKTGVTAVFFKLTRSFPVVTAGLKSCCNVSAVTIALVINTFCRIFLWVVACLAFKFFIYFSILDWETVVNENLFPWEIFSLLIRRHVWVLKFSIALGTGSIKLLETLILI